MREKETRVIPKGEMRAVLDDDGTERIEGYAIRFNEPSADLGGWVEYIDPAAVKLDPDLRAFFDHDSSMVLGRSTAGTLRTRIDEHGVFATIYPPDTQWAQDLMTSMRRGDIDGMSFGFFANDDSWAKRDGVPTRTVLDLDCFELSVVALPAYPSTSASARDAASALLEPHGEGEIAEETADDEAGRLHQTPVSMTA